MLLSITLFIIKQFSLACIVMDKESGNSRGFGYVTFAEPNDADAAKNGLQGWVGNAWF
jgi:RNA recognition motif-containing protein